MVLPVGIIGVAILGINWWPTLAHDICIFNPNPLLREKLDNALLGDQWIGK